MNMNEMDVYKKSKMIIVELYKLEFPKEEIYMLRNQMIRAGHSIMINLCEGSAYKDKKRNRFYKIALGSAYELRSCLEIYSEIYKEIPNNLLNEIDDVCKMIFRLSEKKYTDADTDPDTE